MSKLMEAFSMIPRLKSSKKWTAFPKEYSKQIQTVFKENFAQYLKEGEILIEGRIYPEEILLRVGYLEKGRLAQANFEVSTSYSQEEQDTLGRINNCVDAAAGMLMDYFENDGDVDFPYTWKEFPFQGKKLFVQYTTENSSLEAQANQLLGMDENTLYHDVDEEDEDALSRAEQDEELSPPRDEDKLALSDEEDTELAEEPEESEDSYSEDDEIEDHFAHLDRPRPKKPGKTH